MNNITLPPLPPTQYEGFFVLNSEELHARDLEVVRMMKEAAAQYLDGVHATRLHKFADAIRALEFHHAE